MWHVWNVHKKEMDVIYARVAIHPSNTCTKVAARMDLLESMAGAVWVATILLVFVEEALQASSQWWGYLNGIFYWHDYREYDLFKMDQIY